jgi:uncharacterized protein YoxC
MRFIPLEEASKKPEQLTFVPLEEASKTAAPMQFVPLGQATPTSTPTTPAVPPEEKGFISRNIDWAGDALRSGWENILSSVEGNRQAIADEFITKLEEKYGPGAVNAPPDKQQEYKEAVALAAKSQSERRSIAEKQQQRYALNPQREATQQFKAAITGFDEDKLSFLESASKAGEALISNPAGVIADLGLESTPASIGMLASAILVRFGGGSNLLAAGAGGASSAVTEFGNEYAARRDKGVPHDKAWEDAATKSGVIGLLDAVSMNSAGKAAGIVVDALTGTKRVGKAAKEVGKEIGKQAGLGAAGEAGGSLAIGEVPNPAAVMAEAVGEVFGAPLEAVGTYQRLGPKAGVPTDTPEGNALKELEELDRGRRRPADLTKQEVSNIERQLYAELGREPTDFEVEEAIDDYLDEQNAYRGVESGAGIAGVPSTGVAETAGVPDTTISTAPESGRLDTTGGTPEVAGVGEGAQLGALEDPLAAYQKAEVAFTEAQREVIQLQSAIDELGYEGTREDMAELHAMLTAAEARYKEARQAANDAFQNYEAAQNEASAIAEKSFEELETEREALKEQVEQIVQANVQSAIESASEYGSLKLALESYENNIYDTLSDNGMLNEQTRNYADRAFNRLVEEARETATPTAEEVITEEPAAPTETLEEQYRALSNEELGRITFSLMGHTDEEREAAKAEFNRRISLAASETETPASVESIAASYADKLFEANPDYDVAEYDAAETKLFNDLKAQGLTDQTATDTAAEAFSNRLIELDEGREGGAFKSVMPTPATYISPAVGVVPTNKFGINRLNKLYSDGKISAQEYADGMIKLYEELEDKAAKKSMTQGMGRKRGLGAVIQALEDAANKGRISQETAEFAKWLLLQNPAIANDLAISIKMPQTAFARESFEGVAGFYNDTARIVRIITRKGGDNKYLATSSDVGVHEILHHMERMLPTDLRALIREEWAVRVQKAMDQAVKDNNKEVIKYLALVINGNAAQSSGALQEAENMIKEGKVPLSYYGFLNTSEFWAVNGANILAGRFEAKTGLQKLRQYVKEFIEKIKSIFGLDTNDPIIRGLNAVLKGDGTFLQKRMLADSRGGQYSPSLDTSEKEQKLIEQFRRAGDLQPDVVRAILNNDLNGALNILANRLGGFYGELATKLASLNLQTSIAFDNAADLTYRAIEQTVGPQLQRVMTYMRVADPDYYDKWFKDFDRPENLVRLRVGINTLYFDTLIAKGTGKHSFPEISGEIKSISDAIYKYDTTEAPGAYYNLFDSITLNAKKIEGIGNRVFLHEVVHAATVSVLRADPSQLTKEQLEAREEINKLFSLARRNLKVGEYGLTDKYEFLAELFTNEDFRKLLKAIPYPAAKTNILSRFFNAILRLVGADNLASRAMVEAEKLFTSARYQETKPMGPVFARGKGPLTSAYRSVEDLIASKMPWVKALPGITNFFWNVATGPIRIKLLGALELRHLSDLSKTKFPQISGAVRIVEKMIAHRGRIMTEAAAIAKDWTAAQKENMAQSQLLGRLMLEATLSKVEIDPKNTDINPATKKPYYDQAKVHPKVEAAWNTLDPKFQDIYRRVRDFYRKQLENAIEQMKAHANRIEDTEKRQKLLDGIARDFASDKLVFPYFPLKRFGSYWFQVGERQDKEFYKFETYVMRELNFIKRKAQLLMGNKRQVDLAEQGMDKGNSVSELQTKVSDVSTALKTVNEIVDSLSDDLTNLQDQEERKNTIKEVQDTLREQINQLIYTLMPEQSLRRQMLKREGIQGASSDMLRVFANSATRIAYQQARAKYAAEFIANLNTARAYIKSLKTQRLATPDQLERYRDVVNEVEKRYKPMLGMEDTSPSAYAAGIASDFLTFIMMSAPMSAFLNTVGFMQLATTQIGGRYGYIKATDRLWDNFTTYMGSTVERTIVPLANGTGLSVKFPSAMESTELNGLSKLAAQQLIDEEQVNISQTYDMVGVGDRPSELTLSKYEAMKRVVFAPLHQVERFNREITLLTTFQLEYERLMSQPRRESTGAIIRDAQGNPEMYQNDATTPDGEPYSTEAYEIALSTAKDLTSITLGDTTRQMRPRYFMNPVMALPLKFKRYMITAFYSMYRNFTFGFVEPFKTAEIKQLRRVLESDKQPPDVIEQKIKEAEEFRAEIATEGRKALLGTLAVTGLFTGAVGMPLYNLLMPSLVGMFTTDDDDDEFFDFDNWFRNYMEVEFGGYLGGLLAQLGMDEKKAKKAGEKIGESLAVGPITVLTGGSFTERTSLDFKSLMFRDIRYKPTTREQLLEVLVQALGPAAGLATNYADGIDLLHEGQYGRAFEKFLPAFAAKPLSAYRLATEGAKTKRGETIVDDVTASEIAMQSIGLTPHRIAAAQKQSIQAIEKAQKIENYRKNILSAMWMAHTTNDTEAFNKALKKAGDFSVKYPTLKIGYAEVVESFEKRAKDRAMAEAIGAKVQKKMIPIVSPMLQGRGD